MHEVAGGAEQPNVIAAGAELICRFQTLDRQLSASTHPLAGRESLFVGQAGGGEIYNQSPTEFRMAGTRRWIPGTRSDHAERQYRELLAEVAGESGTHVGGEFIFVRDAFELGESPLVNAFQSAATAVMGAPLPPGPKPFVDDGNTFIARGGVPAITHGPKAAGAHTTQERVPIDELVRVALVYAATSLAFCARQVD
jgi:acetylornithine deacetylase/succinyl-diaminopimelate desuccinylase-like protein